MDEASDESKTEEPVIDRLTRDLRKAFKAVNKAADRSKREAYEAASRAEKHQRRVNRLSTKELASIRQRKADAAAILKSLERKNQQCAGCQCALPVVEDADPIRLCARCESRLRHLSPGAHPDDATQFTEITVFHGGAPGSGKRR